MEVVTLLIHSAEHQFYKNFEEVSKDILELVNSYLKDKMVYLTLLTPKELTVLKVLDHNTGIDIHEGLTIELKDTL